jgi:hypothetical protein
MKPAESEFLGEQRKGRPGFGLLIDNVTFDVAANRSNKCGLWIPIQRFGTAPQACAIAGLFSLNRVIEKADILAPRPFRRARGPAKNARTRYGKYECAVERTVAKLDRLPPGTLQRIGFTSRG